MTNHMGRREWLTYTAVAGSAVTGAALGSRQAQATQSTKAPQVLSRASRPSKRYDMKKSINLWACPYPQQWTLRQCFEIAKDAGFDGVEINFDETGEFSAESTSAQWAAVGAMAREVGIAISGVCSFLFWPYALTHNDPAKRKRGVELARAMIRAAKAVGTTNLLVVPGAVYAPWVAGFEPTPNDVCHQRAVDGIRTILPDAQREGISINLENIFMNGFLFSPQEMAGFIDQFQSDLVQAHFDTGNIMQYQFPEHWIPILGKRIKNIHFKEADKRVQEFNLHTFRTLLDGTTNWPAVIEALDKIEYRGYLTFEYFHPLQHYPEALIYQTSDALDWMLGRKA
jgi:hexulose-6-phosphate isomerase